LLFFKADEIQEAIILTYMLFGSDPHKLNKYSAK